MAGFKRPLTELIEASIRQNEHFNRIPEPPLVSPTGGTLPAAVRCSGHIDDVVSRRREPGQRPLVKAEVLWPSSCDGV